jgi:hypothetical protein
MINPNTSTSQTELQDIQQENSRGAISNATRASGNFGIMYPLSAALEIPVIDAGPGFDVLDLEARLGPERFGKLIASIDRIFVANHRKYPDGHELAGHEVHCCYGKDVEAFLAKEGK